MELRARDADFVSFLSAVLISECINDQGGFRLFQVLAGSRSISMFCELIEILGGIVFCGIVRGLGEVF